MSVKRKTKEILDPLPEYNQVAITTNETTVRFQSKLWKKKSGAC